MPNFFKKMFATPLTNDYTNNQGPGPRIPKKPLLVRLLRALVAILFISASLIIISNWINDDYYDDYNESYPSDKKTENNKDLGYSSKHISNECNVTGISIIGSIVTFSSDEENLETASEDIMYYFRSEENDDSVKAVLLEIDSYGGYPVAAEEIAEAIKRFNKPVIVLIREYGNSAAYWVASAADIIFASKNSELGSIGINSSYLDYSEYNERDGIKYIEITGGKYKAAGDPDRSLSEEERELLLRDTKILHDNFIKAVAENRNMDIEKVRELADGSTMLGQMALDNGLIDRIGVYHNAIDYIEELIGEEADVCWY